MSRITLFAIGLIVTVLLASGCQKQDETKPDSPKTSGEQQLPKGLVKPGGEPPPAPPIKEDFEGAPKLSLFPQAGRYSPEDADKEGKALWLTYIDHLERMSGPIRSKNGTAFAFRNLRNVNSAGFFSPLAVEPDKNYRASFRFWGKLPKGGSAGAGILEYSEFLWISDQFSKSLSDKYLQRTRTGVQLSGDHEGTLQSFSFRTGPKTRMIHLVLFREGTPAKEPIVIDDIEIRPE